MCKTRAWKDKNGWADIEAAVCEGKRPAYPPKYEVTEDVLVEEMKKIIESCWAQNVLERMTMSAAKVMLEKAAQANSIAIPSESYYEDEGSL